MINHAHLFNRSYKSLYVCSGKGIYFSRKFAIKFKLLLRWSEHFTILYSYQHKLTVEPFFHYFVNTKEETIVVKLK